MNVWLFGILPLPFAAYSAITFSLVQQVLFPNQMPDQYLPCLKRDNLYVIQYH